MNNKIFNKNSFCYPEQYNNNKAEQMESQTRIKRHKQQNKVSSLE